MLAAVIGAILATVVIITAWDIRDRAPAYEQEACLDEPDMKAYMARLPGEPHTVEMCIKMMRYGSPRYVPEFGHPLKPRREG